MVIILPVIILFSYFLVFPQTSLAGITPIPTGSSTGCILDFQSPQTTVKCADCLMLNQPAMRQKYNAAQHTSCGNREVSNHWCNGGQGPEEQASCNALKFGICSQPPENACVVATPIPGVPFTPTPTPPATQNTVDNPRGCGILYTNGVPSCWCNNGGGQGLCGNMPLDGPGGCRDQCEKGVFTGPKGFTHCYMMPDNSECHSNNDGSYRFCEKRCLPANPGFSQKIGCTYPNKTVFENARFDPACIIAFNKSSNYSFFGIIDSFFKGVARIIDVRNYLRDAVRVPGLQKADCNPASESCTFE